MFVIISKKILTKKKQKCQLLPLLDSQAMNELLCYLGPTDVLPPVCSWSAAFEASPLVVETFLGSWCGADSATPEVPLPEIPAATHHTGYRQQNEFAVKKTFIKKIVSDLFTNNYRCANTLDVKNWLFNSRQVQLFMFHKNLSAE